MASVSADHFDWDVTTGLGTYARRLGEMGNTAELERIGKLLVSLLQQSKTRSLRLDALAGISNSGYAGALPAVQPLLEHADPIVRAGAVQAIRLMKHPEVDALIAARLKDDKPDVRVAAVQAAQNRDPRQPLADALSKCALNDDIARVRMQAVRLLVRWSKDLPALRSVLEQVAQRDAEQAIRRLTASAVQAAGP